MTRTSSEASKPSRSRGLLSARAHRAPPSPGQNLVNPLSVPAACPVMQELNPDCHLVKLGTMGEYGEPPPPSRPEILLSWGPLGALPWGPPVSPAHLPCRPGP